METLEAISKVTLQDMEQRLTTGPAVEAVEDLGEEPVMTGDELLDLTSGEEELSFSTDELDSLQLESDLSGNIQETESPLSSPLETKPIGYDSDIPVEEIEIRDYDHIRRIDLAPERYRIAIQPDKSQDRGSPSLCSKLGKGLGPVPLIKGSRSQYLSGGDNALTATTMNLNLFHPVFSEKV